MLQDRRIRLFLTDAEITDWETRLQQVEPLFLPGDFYVFDVSAGGDPYEDDGYIRRFRLALDAIKRKRPLLAVYESGKGKISRLELLPQRMQYSQKDDKFRLIGESIHPRNHQLLLNMGRMLSLERLNSSAGRPEKQVCREKRSVRLAIYGERNALERCMLQFAAYDKQTIYEDEKSCHICEIFYDILEETELLIRILSFGPVVEVLGPERMLRQVRQRVQMQIMHLTDENI